MGTTNDIDVPERGEGPANFDEIEETDLQPIADLVQDHLAKGLGGSFEIILDTRRAVVNVNRMEDDVRPNTPSVPRIMFHENAAEVLGERNVIDRLKMSPVFLGVGVNIMKTIAQKAQILGADEGAEIISKGGLVKGLLIPMESDTGVQIVVDEEGIPNKQITGRNLKKYDFLGEYMMALGYKPTSSVVCVKKGGAEFLYVPHELFESLHGRSQETVYENIIKKSPLTKYQIQDPDKVDPEMADKTCVDFPPMPKVSKIINDIIADGLGIEGDASFAKEYVAGDQVKAPGLGYFGLISRGGVTVANETVEPFSHEILADIADGNIIFEANALGVITLKNIKISAGISGTTIVYVDLNPAMPNYKEILRALLDGQHSKLTKANLRRAAIQKS